MKVKPFRAMPPRSRRQKAMTIKRARLVLFRFAFAILQTLDSSTARARARSRIVYAVKAGNLIQAAPGLFALATFPLGRAESGRTVHDHSSIGSSAGMAATESS
jgi:hypothetical protein